MPPAAAGVRRQQRRVLARVIGVGRGWVDAVVGGEDQEIVVTEQIQPIRGGGVDLGQGASKALNVVPVPVDLIGLDQVHEDETAFQRLQ